MQSELLSVKRESSKTEFDEESLRYLSELISKYEMNNLNSGASKASDYDLIVEGLTNCYIIECKKSESLSQRIRKSLSSFTILPSTTVNDYLSNTTLNISANKSIAGDWKKVGNQIWLSYLKQAEAKR